MLVELATSQCKLPVLRTYWYDGARDGIPTPSQQVVAALANVKLRLGRLNVNNQQKGVDALIYRDLMTLARERAICEAFLLSGDEDLREGVHAAQDQGVRVTVVGIRPASQEYNQSKVLLAEADEVVRLERSQIRGFFSKVPSHPPASSPPVSLDTKSIGDVGKRFAREWLTSATEADKAALRVQQPRIPKTLDVELMKFAEVTLGISLREQDELHRDLRGGFWRAMSQLAGSDDPSTSA